MNEEAKKESKTKVMDKEKERNENYFWAEKYGGQIHSLLHKSIEIKFSSQDLKRSGAKRKNGSFQGKTN